MAQIPFSVYDFFGYLAAGFIVLVAADYAFNDAAELHSSLGTAEAVVWVVLAYVAGHALANVARTVIERWIVERLIGRVPVENLLGKEPKRRFQKYVFSDYFGALDEHTRQEILARAKAAKLPELDLGKDSDSRDAARALRTLAEYSSPGEPAEADGRFTILRDFCRNASMACVVASAMILLAESPPSRAWGYAAGAASVALFYRFLRFHRHHAADLLRRFSVSPLNPPGGAVGDVADRG